MSGQPPPPAHNNEWGGPLVRFRCEDVERRVREFTVDGTTRLAAFIERDVVPHFGVATHYLDKKKIDVDTDERTVADVCSATLYVVQRSRGTILADGKRDFLLALPEDVQKAIKANVSSPDLLEEVYLQVGRHPEVRLRDERTVRRLNGEGMPVFLQYDADALFQKYSFSEDGRAVVDGVRSQKKIRKNHTHTHTHTHTHIHTHTQGAPHRISVIRYPFPDGVPTGFSLRFARWVEGAAEPLYKHARAGKSILLIGRPGSGKTTILKDLVRELARDSSTLVVDYLGEICGAGAQPHEFVADARRVEIRDRSHRARALAAGVANHCPQWLVVDELLGDDELEAATVCSYRGVRVAASVHGSDLKSVVLNPATVQLMGGAQPVILSQMEREQQRKVRKVAVERVAEPVFDVVVEVLAATNWRVIERVADAVDLIHLGKDYAQLAETL